MISRLSLRIDVLFFDGERSNTSVDEARIFEMLIARDIHASLPEYTVAS